MFKRKKYNNEETIVDGIKFDSIKEAKYYIFLKDLLDKKLISNLELQPVFLLQDKFIDKSMESHRKIEYKADFRYYDNLVDEEIIIDVKGLKTEIYKLKKKLLLAKFTDINFMEI